MFEGVWSLTLLTYSHLVYTSVSIVNCRLLNGKMVSGPTVHIIAFKYSVLHMSLLQRWFVDGSVVCYEKGHLGLAFLAIISLIIAVALIPFTAFIVYYDKIKRVSGKAPVSLKLSILFNKIIYCSKKCHRWPTIYVTL